MLCEISFPFCLQGDSFTEDSTSCSSEYNANVFLVDSAMKVWSTNLSFEGFLCTNITEQLLLLPVQNIVGFNWQIHCTFHTATLIWTHLCLATKFQDKCSLPIPPPKKLKYFVLCVTWYVYQTFFLYSSDL